MRMLSFPDLAEHRAICLRAFIVTERVTLITGASAGIGTELARVFASNGHRVALVARRAERLAALASEIKATGGAGPVVIAYDLEQSVTRDKITAPPSAQSGDYDVLVPQSP